MHERLLKKLMYSAWVHFFVLWFNFYTALIGLDWKELEELLNPDYPWEDAVRAALGTNYSLNTVCRLLLSRCT